MVATILVERGTRPNLLRCTPSPGSLSLSKNGQTKLLTKSPLLAGGHLGSRLTPEREQALLGAGLRRAGMGASGCGAVVGSNHRRAALAPSDLWILPPDSGPPGNLHSLQNRTKCGEV